MALPGRGWWGPDSWHSPRQRSATDIHAAVWTLAGCPTARGPLPLLPLAQDVSEPNGAVQSKAPHGMSSGPPPGREKGSALADSNTCGTYARP